MAFSKSQVAMDNERDWNYCDRCDETDSPNWKCIDCDEVLCKKCKKIHLSARKYKIHRIISYKDRNKEVNSKSNLYCKMHPEQKIITCCDTCQVPVCEECLYLEHSNHELIKIRKFAEEKRKTLIRGARENFESLRKTHCRESLKNVKEVGKSIQVSEIFGNAFSEASLSVKKLKDEQMQLRAACEEKSRKIEIKMLEIYNKLDNYQQTLSIDDRYVVQNFEKPGLKFSAEIPEEFLTVNDDTADDAEFEILETCIQKIKEIHQLRSSRESSTSKYLVVAAIYLGSSCSGNAFSFKWDYEKSKLDISFIRGRNKCLETMATTAVLLNPDETFHSYGDEAIQFHTDLVDDGKHEALHFIKHFPIQICKEKSLQLKCTNGNDVAALKIYEMSIKYYKELFVKHLEHSKTDVTDADMQWIIVVPSFMTENQKQMIEKAANRAEICGDLAVVLDSETISTYCREIPIDDLGGKDLSFMAFLPGTKQLILHVEYEVVYYTILKLQRYQQCKQSHNQIVCYGPHICNKIKEILTEYVGGRQIDELMKDQEELDALLSEFKRNVRVTDHDTRKDVRITVTPQLFQILEKSSSRFSCHHSHSFKLLKNSKIAIRKAIFNSFFDELITEIVQEAEELIKTEEIKYILMAGEMAESSILQRKIRCVFPKLTVLIPPEPNLAVLKGAVLYGHQ